MRYVNRSLHGLNSISGTPRATLSPRPNPVFSNLALSKLFDERGQQGASCAIWAASFSEGEVLDVGLRPPWVPKDRGSGTRRPWVPAQHNCPTEDTTLANQQPVMLGSGRWLAERRWASYWTLTATLSGIKIVYASSSQRFAHAHLDASPHYILRN